MSTHRSQAELKAEFGTIPESSSEEEQESQGVPEQSGGNSSQISDLDSARDRQYPRRQLESEQEQSSRQLEDSALYILSCSESDLSKREEWALAKTWEFVDILKKQRGIPDSEQIENLQLHSIARWFYRVWTQEVSWKTLRNSGEEEEVTSKCSVEYQDLFRSGN